MSIFSFFRDIFFDKIEVVLHIVDAKPGGEYFIKNEGDIHILQLPISCTNMDCNGYMVDNIHCNGIEYADNVNFIPDISER